MANIPQVGITKILNIKLKTNKINTYENGATAKTEGQYEVYFGPNIHFTASTGSIKEDETNKNYKWIIPSNDSEVIKQISLDCQYVNPSNKISSNVATFNFAQFGTSNKTGGDDSTDDGKFEAIDLDLPSGTKWANMNIGSKKAEDYGLYFQWADSSGYTQGHELSYDTYKWYKNGGESNPDKYNLSDNLVKIGIDDDAAYLTLGSEWHIPTFKQISELVNETTTGITSINKISGITFTSKINSEKSIFIPFGGWFYNSYYPKNKNERFFIWGNELGIVGTLLNGNAQRIFDRGISLAYEDDEIKIKNSLRPLGFNIRGVIGNNERNCKIEIYLRDDSDKINAISSSGKKIPLKIKLYKNEKLVDDDLKPSKILLNSTGLYDSISFSEEILDTELYSEETISIAKNTYGNDFTNQDFISIENDTFNWVLSENLISRNKIYGYLTATYHYDSNYESESSISISQNGNTSLPVCEFYFLNTDNTAFKGTKSIILGSKLDESTGKYAYIQKDGYKEEIAIDKIDSSFLSYAYQYISTYENKDVDIKVLSIHRDENLKDDKLRSYEKDGIVKYIDINKKDFAVIIDKNKNTMQIQYNALVPLDAFKVKYVIGENYEEKYDNFESINLILDYNPEMGTGAYSYSKYGKQRNKYNISIQFYDYKNSKTKEIAYWNDSYDINFGIYSSSLTYPENHLYPSSYHKITDEEHNPSDSRVSIADEVYARKYFEYTIEYRQHGLTSEDDYILDTSGYTIDNGIYSFKSGDTANLSADTTNNRFKINFEKNMTEHKRDIRLTVYYSSSVLQNYTVENKKVIYGDVLPGWDCADEIIFVQRADLNGSKE